MIIWWSSYFVPFFLFWFVMQSKFAYIGSLLANGPLATLSHIKTYISQTLTCSRSDSRHFSTMLQHKHAEIYSGSVQDWQFLALWSQSSSSSSTWSLTSRWHHYPLTRGSLHFYIPFCSFHFARFHYCFVGFWAQLFLSAFYPTRFHSLKTSVTHNGLNYFGVCLKIGFSFPFTFSSNKIK